MKRTFAALLFGSLIGLVVGCGAPPTAGPENAALNAASPSGAAEAAGEDDPEIKEALAELPEADRAAAESQRFCAVEQENRLGSMGKPFKVVLDGQSVFLCCAGCEDAANADPAKTLAKARELKTVK